jgi:hypothetical protein
MLEEVGRKLVGEVGWGLKARVGVGALASISDLGTGEIRQGSKRQDYSNDAGDNKPV